MKISRILLRIAVTALAAIISIAARAEEFNVEFFEIDNFDTTANSRSTIHYDLNGEKCALIKVQTTLRDIAFDAGYNYIHTVPQDADHPAEIWVYVSPDTRRISLQHAEAGSIRDYDLKTRLKAGTTYRMGLTNIEVTTVSANYDHPVDLIIHADPGSTTVAINGVPIVTDKQGYARTTIAGGRHTYRASAPMHHPVDGRLQLNNDNDTLSISLPKAYGWLNIPDSETLSGADVIIDGNNVGTAPLTRLPVPSGHHSIRIS